ncbi:MAG: DUF4248 domain-containing protein [Chitinophagales bacterium]|nr:DUF4248 domain-containing protein [Chitinophagales bacterium]
MEKRAMTKIELADAYGINKRTLREWLDRAGLIGEDGLFTMSIYRKIRLFTPKQISQIVDKIGEW